MARSPLRIVLDTNILVSSLIFGGKPDQVERLILEKQVVGITSLILLAELLEVLTKKFHFNQFRIKQTEKKIKKNFTLVQPSKILRIVKDEADNRILEAAIEGNCSYIVTGDKELLDLGIYSNVKIVDVNDFLNRFTMIK